MGITYGMSSALDQCEKEGQCCEFNSDSNKGLHNNLNLLSCSENGSCFLLRLGK